MEIYMHRLLRGSTSLIIDEKVLKDVNAVLAHSYVIANNLSEAPQIESVEMLEKLLKEHRYGDEYTNDYDILYKCFVKEDGSLDANAYYKSLYDTVYEMIIDYPWDEPFEIDDCDTIDYDFEVRNK